MGIISPQCHEASVKAHKGRRSYNWKGGRIVEGSTGYILLWKPEHPNAKVGRRRSYVYEHRYVMSEHLGRPLESFEFVHHRNGIKDDNRIANLRLFSSTSEHMKHERAIGTYTGKGFQKGIPPVPHRKKCRCFRCSGILTPHRRGCKCFRCCKKSPTAYSFPKGQPPVPHQPKCQCFRCKANKLRQHQLHK